MKPSLGLNQGSLWLQVLGYAPKPMSYLVWFCLSCCSLAFLLYIFIITLFINYIIIVILLATYYYIFLSCLLNHRQWEVGEKQCIVCARIELILKIRWGGTARIRRG